MLDHNIWLKYAEDDLKVAKIILNSEEIVIGAVLYHSQQAAEKSLKAYLVYKKQEPRKVHDLIYLVYTCAEFDNEFNELLSDASDLNPYVARTRYPDSAFLMLDTSSALDAVKKAARFIEFVKDKTA